MKGIRTPPPGQRRILLLREDAGRLRPQRVDREAGIIRGVRILGPDSSNNREYSDEALRDAVKERLYEGAAVYTDHPDDPDDERSIKDKIAQIFNVRLSRGGLYGDLLLMKSHPMYQSVMEAASDDRKKDWFGLSHNARGETEVRNGRVIVLRITEVASVDLVSNPATTSGLFESRQKKTAKGSKPMAKTANKQATRQAVLESLKKLSKTEKKRLKAILLEMGSMDPTQAMEEDDSPALGVDDTGSGEDAGQEESPDASPEDALWNGFRTTLLSVIDDDDMDVNAKVSKLRKLLKAHESLKDEDGEEGEEGMDEEAVEEDDAAMEEGEGEEEDGDHDEDDGHDVSEGEDEEAAAPVKENKDCGYAKESKSALIRKLKRRDKEDASRALCEQHKVVATGLLVEALVNLPPGKRTRFLEMWQKGQKARKDLSESQRPTTQRPGSKSKGDSVTFGDIKDGEGFAKALLASEDE